ncbi:Alpha/Beta hydrolase protein [Cytidiella melzeri]|nr:Alpha/Beta hydrolase protein [Cytidiella melzeri]
MAPPSPEKHVEHIQAQVRQRHVQQLKNLSMSEKGSWNDPSFNLPSYFQYMEKWSVKARHQIHAAIAARAVSGPDIDWNVGLYAFMESAAVYLRDWPTLFLASQAARKGRTEEALELLANSDAEIRKLASMWHPDLRYVTICVDFLATDLVEEHPDSDPTLDGPFCGVFFSSNPQRPFIGIVFKGTHVESWEEMLVDLRYIPVESTGGRLWDTHVSQGVFATLFGPFPKLGGQTPFDYIQKVIAMITAGNSNRPADVHVTGHSLGASYATLCYAELLRLSQLNPSSSKIILRDLYTFGSPRVALEDFVSALSTSLSPSPSHSTPNTTTTSISSSSSTHTTHSRRITTVSDPVTLVPPVLLTDPTFVHVDGEAWQVAEEKEPVRLKSEVGTHPRPPLPLFDMSNHTPFAYFKALYYTATSGAPGGER